MNEPWDDIAAELARLEPRGTSERLNRRVEQALETTTVVPLKPLRPWWSPWAPLAAAAAVVLVVAVTVALKQEPAAPLAADPRTGESNGVAVPPPAAFVADPAFRRVNQVHYLLEAADDGLIYTSNTTPFRKVRWQYLSASEWRDDRDGTTFRVLIPREETVVIPVNIQ